MLAHVGRRSLVNFVDVAFHRVEGFALKVAQPALVAISDFYELFTCDG
jgi:hypothetical protein